jgi:methionyl-tRNA formyltransferase
LELIEVQPEGKGPLAATSWRNGARLEAGEHLV